MFVFFLPTKHMDFSNVKLIYHLFYYHFKYCIYRSTFLSKTVLFWTPLKWAITILHILLNKMLITAATTEKNILIGIEAQLKYCIINNAWRCQNIDVFYPWICSACTCLAQIKFIHYTYKTTSKNKSTKHLWEWIKVTQTPAIHQSSLK